MPTVIIPDVFIFNRNIIHIKASPTTYMESLLVMVNPTISSKAWCILSEHNFVMACQEFVKPILSTYLSGCI